MGKGQSFKISDAGPIGCPNGIDMHLDPLCHNICKHQRQDVGLRVKGKTRTLLEDQMGDHLHDFEVSESRNAGRCATAVLLPIIPSSFLLLALITSLCSSKACADSSSPLTEVKMPSPVTQGPTCSPGLCPTPLLQFSTDSALSHLVVLCIL